MSPHDLWDNIIHKAEESEFEIHTIPKNKSIPRWFLVGADGNCVIIKKAITNRPSVELSTDRRITFKDFNLVYDFYKLWKKGTVGIRHEVSQRSRNTAYIFSLIAEFEL